MVYYVNHHHVHHVYYYDQFYLAFSAFMVEDCNLKRIPDDLPEIRDIFVH